LEKSWERVTEEGPKSPHGFLSLSTIFILSLFPEIRMSKPLEAEKQGLDSPSEHTGGLGGEGEWAHVKIRMGQMYQGG
jgi:hypothetical protein